LLGILPGILPVGIPVQTNNNNLLSAVSSLLATIDAVQGDLSQLPQEILNALNKIASLIGASVSDLVNILNQFHKPSNIFFTFYFFKNN
jgi:hypothetical protein